MQKRIRWTVASSRSDMGSSVAVCEIARELGVSLPTAQLLVNRGCTTPESAVSFLSKAEERLYDPFLMKDMDRAVARISKALREGEKIVIFGDYDVDGVTSVSCLYLYLESRGGNVSYYIPQRAGEGYGVSVSAIEKLAADGASLIITVDTGITAVDEIEAARRLGVDVVVTDHHECHENLPDAVAVINPRRPDCGYPFKELAGVGVVFKLLCALEYTLSPENGLRQSVRKIADAYCDLVAIGTIADVMPVRDENRPIVSYGLALIEKTERPGLAELFNAVSTDGKTQKKKKITASFIGYTIAPRINAAGRISSASIAVELLLADTAEKAAPIAEHLCEINRERQTGENAIVEEAYAKLEAEHDFTKEPVIILDDEKWNHGIIGIVASRLTEKYSCPSILISFDGSENGEVGKGSGRSVKGLNLVDALRSCSDLLEKFGGHELAVGLAIRRENLPEFRRRLNEYAREKLEEGIPEPVLEAECELSPEDITIGQAEELYCLEPYGVSNPVPVFVMYDVPLFDVTVVGTGKHTRLTLKIGQNYVTAMAFRKTAEELDVYPGDRVDIMFSLDINEFRGQKSVQFIVKDVRLSETLYRAGLEDSRICSVLCDMNTPSSSVREQTDPSFLSSVIPERDDFAGVYGYLRRELRTGGADVNIRGLRNLLKNAGISIGYAKLRLILSVFEELNFITLEPKDRERDIFRISLVQQSGKTPLTSSLLYSRLISLISDQAD